jgi:hypothetical protein
MVKIKSRTLNMPIPCFAREFPDRVFFSRGLGFLGGICQYFHQSSISHFSTNQQFLMNHFNGIKIDHECGENPYDAVSFAVKSALYAT